MRPSLQPSAAPSPAPEAIPALVSVVIPASDEALNLPSLLEGLHGVLETRAERHEILVVVPRGDDATADAARGAGATVLVQKRPGYGGALKEGLLAARGDYVVTMDGDLSHPPETVAELLAHRDDAELVVASRYAAGGSSDASPLRAALSRVLNLVYSRALATPVRDTSSGFRIYRRRALRALDEVLGEKYDILPEILVLLHCQGWRVSEIPFHYRERGAGDSHARPLGFAPHFLATLTRLFKLRNRFQAADYDSRAHDTIVWPQRYWQRRRFALVNGMAGTGGRRLDVGCGSSRIIQSHPESVGLDLEPAKLRFLRRTNPKLLRGTTFALPVADASFDVVVHSQVIEHVRFDPVIFSELFRVLRPGGTLVIGTPDYGRVQWRVIERLYKLLMPNGYADDHITHYTRHSLVEALVAAGFGIERYAYILGGELVVQATKRDGPTP